MKSLATSSFIVLGTFAQYENWTCNHFSGLPVDVCYQYSSTYQYYFECDGTDSLTFYGFNDGSCGTSNPNPDSEITYNQDDVNNSISFNCDESENCPYGLIRYYSDEDCTGDSYVETPFIFGQCYSGTIVSYDYACNGSIFTLTTYSDGNCETESSSTSFDYDDYSDSLSGCYEV